jgi:hypothetical protein
VAILCAAVPLRPVSRPDFTLRGLDWATVREMTLPSDAANLWASYRGLAPERQRQFLQAAAKWQEALSASHDGETLSVSFLVVACEALKAPGKRYEHHNVTHVVAALLGEAVAKSLDHGWFHAQAVRSGHLHLGEFWGPEFLQAAIHSSYQDPTFDEARRRSRPSRRKPSSSGSGAAACSPCRR